MSELFVLFFSSTERVEQFSETQTQKPKVKRKGKKAKKEIKHRVEQKCEAMIRSIQTLATKIH